MNRTLVMFALLLLNAWQPQARAAVPETMSYQGVLTDGSGNPLTGSHTLTFRIHTVPVGGANLWTESHSVTLNQGGFSVILGSMTPLNLLFDQQYYLSISVDGGPQLSPRAPLAASPYSLSLRLPFYGYTNSTVNALDINNDGGNAIRGASGKAGDVPKIGDPIFGGAGVFGSNQTFAGVGVHGVANGEQGVAVLAESNYAGPAGPAVWARNTGAGTGARLATSASAGLFDGNVTVFGTLSKSAGSFRIDHPLDPANKYLSHSFVESPDMMNIYNGNADLDAAGEAWLELPTWFESLNMEFRYQLTAIGAPGPNLYVAEEISNNRFRVAGGTPGGRVSWQVTGIRHDPYAEKHRVPLEEDKSLQERGRYLHPDLYGASAEQSIGFARHPEAKDDRSSDLRPAREIQAAAPGVILTSRLRDQNAASQQTQKQRGAER